MCQVVLHENTSMCILKFAQQGDIYRVWGQVKMMFIPVPGKVNYTQAKAHCPINLVSFMQKTMQKLVTRNIKEETLGHDTYIYKNLPTNQVSPQKLQCTMSLHLYRKQWKTLLSAKWHFITQYL